MSEKRDDTVELKTAKNTCQKLEVLLSNPKILAHANY